MANYLLSSFIYQTLQPVCSMPDSVNIRKLTLVLALKALPTSEAGRRQSSSCVLCAVYMEVASDNSALGILMGRVVAEEAVPI